MRTYLSSCTSWYITHPHEFIYDLYRDIKAFIHRGLYGWAHCDAWSIDYYLNTIIPNMLNVLRENMHGCPCELTYNPEDGKSLQPIEEGVKDWKEILLIIEESFRLSRYLFNDYSFTEDPCWKDDMSYPELIQMDNDFIDYGMQLFLQFYGNLWD